jgi:hypothetical protein
LNQPEQLASRGEDPMAIITTKIHIEDMKTLFLAFKLLFLFGGSGFCLGGLVGCVVGLILLICIVLQLTDNSSHKANHSPPD